jgi:hypothetical protein
MTTSKSPTAEAANVKSDLIPSEDLPPEPKAEQQEDNSSTTQATGFRKIPIEIRLQIYRLLFPGSRQVCLDSDLPWTFNYESAVHAKNRLPLPLSLYINHESRAETLRYYSVIFKQDFAAFANFEPFAERPLLFDPTIDSAYITFSSLQTTEGENCQRFNDWLIHLNRELPGGIKAIKWLEIRDVNWEGEVKTVSQRGAQIFFSVQSRSNDLETYPSSKYFINLPHETISDSLVL